MEIEAVSGWQAEIGVRLPGLPRWAQRGLAEWSFGIAVTQQCGITTVSTLIAELGDERPNTVRQRLREFYQQADKKRGPGRTEFDVTGTFAPLLAWAWSLRAAGQTTLALALDATHLRDVFTVLSVSVLVPGGAVPVAWQVVAAQQVGAYRPHIERLFSLLQGAIPAEVSVLVTADRGLYAPWLFAAITAQGWHPMLRINASGRYRSVDATRHALADLVPVVGQTFAEPVVCFTAQPLTCTLVAKRDPQHAEPWLVVTDLAPDQVDVAWYGVRAWIEAGFKDLKRGGLKWHLSRTTIAAHAARQWLALSVALLYLLGSAPQPHPGPDPTGQPPPRRLLSAMRHGFLRVLARLIRALPSLPLHLDLDWHAHFAR